MKIFSTAIFLFCLSSLCFSQDSVYSEKSIDSAIVNFKQKWKIPGISVAIAKDGRLFYAKGFGYADTLTKEPVTTNSLFRIASCSKTITAIAIMKLIENNRLGLDDKVFGEHGILNDAKYLNIADSNVYKITVKNLLQQTAGWINVDIIGDNDAAYALKTPIPAGIDDNIIYILQQKLDFPPSTAYRYSDFNYLFLGEIISKIVKKDHTEYILSEILHPIGVYTTIPGKSTLAERAVNEVVYYDYFGQTRESVFDTTQIAPQSYTCNIVPMISSGGWISRPIDMVKIVLSIDGLDSPADILTKKSVALMTTVPGNIKTRYGMGMVVTKKNAWTHSGEWTWGTSAVWYKTVDNICYAITCNTLPTIHATEEEQYSALKVYDRDMTEFLLPELGKIKSYPDINLFETKGKN